MSDDLEWWQTFFPDLYSEVQRAQDAPGGETREQAGFIAKTLGVEPPARLLDVPCGAGRHALELAAMGYRVVGVDLTAPAIETARRKAAERRLQIDWLETDMRELPWQEEFDGAYCFFGSFGYFDDAGNRRFLDAVHRALRPGARFLIETHVVETILPRFQKQGWSRFGDAILLEERRYDHEQGRIETDWTLVSGGKVTRRKSSIRLYTYSELIRILVSTGFTHAGAFDTTTGLPFELNAARLCVVVTRE